MITRQSCYDALFKLKNAGIDVSRQLENLARESGIPREVTKFLIDNSPQFQFYEYLHKKQKALMKNILNFESFNDLEKIKLCSSMITRAMIAVEYKNFSESLLEDLELSRLSSALDKALSDKDYYEINKVLKQQKDSMKLFVKERGINE